MPFRLSPCAGQYRPRSGRRNDRTPAAAGSASSRLLHASLSRTSIALALSFSKQLGATETLSERVPQQVAELTDGVGVDIAIEAVGKTEAVNTAIDSVRKGGTVVLVGNISPEISLPLQKVVSRQIRLQGSCASAGEYPRAIELMSTGAFKSSLSSPPSRLSPKAHNGLNVCMRASRI